MEKIKEEKETKEISPEEFINQLSHNGVAAYQLLLQAQQISKAVMELKDVVKEGLEKLISVYQSSFESEESSEEE